MGRLHYQELLSFLRSHLAKEQTGPRSNAREKLTRLSKQQFTELSTDVYDELMRRITNAKEQQATGVTPHLAVRDEFHPKRNQARQKLATLPKTRFRDLSSDVFFELERRFPELKEEFRPDAIQREREAEQREQERLAAARLAEEQERTQSSSRDLQRPPAAQESTSDVVIPKKSTLVEEDVSVPYSVDAGHPERASMDGSEVPDNRSTMYSQASSVGTGFYNGYGGNRGGAESVASPNLGSRSSQLDSHVVEKLRSDYEFKIATLNQRISSLETNNDDLKQQASQANRHESKVRDLEADREHLRSLHARELQSLQSELERHRDQHDAKHRDLLDSRSKLASAEGELQRALASGGGNAEDFERMQDTMTQQENTISDFRGEVESLVQEIQVLSGRNEELVNEKDQDILVIRDLNAQIQSFKRKYEQARTELRQFKATSQLYVAQAKADEFLSPTEGGAIADVNVTAFQTSIDEMLMAARSTTPSAILMAMKAVVLATTLITDDAAKVEQSPTQLPGSDAEQLTTIKTKISTSLNGLMTACRNHASSHGTSPISLVDAAASHVSSTVVDLVKLLKTRPATAAEKEQFEAHFSGNSLPPGGLKPLHIATGGTALSTSRHQPFSALDGPTDNRSPHRSISSNAGPDRLGLSEPNNVERLSPRQARAPSSSAQFGRYSPVGYRPVGNPTDSAGDWAARAQSSRSRATSFASSSSANGQSPNGPAASSGAHPREASEAVPALPRTDLSSIKSQWASPQRRSFATSNGRRGSDSLAQQGDGGNDSSGSMRRGASGQFDGSSLSASSSFLATQPPLSLTGNGGASGEEASEENWAELRNYIEVQTEAIVHSIQALLSAIREGAQGVQLNENLVQITTIASSIVVISKENLPNASRAEGEEIISDLQKNCDKLSEMQTRPDFDKGTKSAMASASYGVAKGLKALNGLLNSVDVGNGNGNGNGNTAAVASRGMPAPLTGNQSPSSQSSGEHYDYSDDDDNGTYQHHHHHGGHEDEGDFDLS